MIVAYTLMCCDNGIDPITEVDPGPDQSPPIVKINFPADGLEIQVKEDVIPITIKFEVDDDIEVASIEAKMDGKTIGQYSSFKDYRRIIIDDLVYTNLTNGEHTLIVTSIDTDGKETTEVSNFLKKEAYKPIYDGETFYMPFNGDYTELVSVTTANEIGSPSFAGESVVGPNAYLGATDSYLTFPTEGLLGEEFSATFWYKVNADPDRAGILVISPPDEENPDSPNDRTKGIRFFRENANGNQRLKLNIGTGSGETWVDGAEAADIASNSDWVQVAFTISATKAIVYIDGQIVKEVDFVGVDWTGCDLLSIGSGSPRFTGWGHLSDLSEIDELRIYNKALTQQEIQDIRAADL
ncbi:LamG domain-containing protein [Galbibacter sp. CMA-7]|uniref:LamG domain-containing protein n=2 Tax=Galbibacter pacificus TaxID=2996052 RepID=A0ABT6FP03_9FLAO|nr:LamG domain-containing protein [Galbibacter pacificus]MDG3581522.1 LamG domain-containing protein [Galbibacter pacificus]MDG3585000.1 LamG domain-containing protein [Galbibacter pacificus]